MAAWCASDGSEGGVVSSGNGYESLGKGVLFFLTLALATVVRGLVLTRLWAWFVADTFGLRGLSVAQAVGFAMLFSFLVSHPVAEVKKNDKSFGTLLTEALIKVVLANGVTLLLGLAVVQFT